MKINIAGVWHDATPFIKVRGVWKSATPYKNVGGIWKSEASPLTYNNLTLNSSFENNSANWIGLTDTYVGTAKASNGAKAIRFLLANANKTISQKITVPNGNKVYMTVDIYVESGSMSGNSYGNFTDYNLAVLASLVKTPTLGTWMKLSAIVTAANGGVGFSLGRGTNQICTLWYDACMTVDLTTNGLASHDLAWCNANLPFKV